MMTGVWFEMIYQSMWYFGIMLVSISQTPSGHGLRPPYRMHMEFFPFYCPVLNKTEEFYSVWRWKVLRLPATYSDDPAGCHGCNMRGHHSRRLQRRDKTFQKILSVLHRREDIHWDVDENLWPDRGSVERQHCNSPYSAACAVLPKGCFLYLHF